MDVSDVLKLAVELSGKIASEYCCRIVASALYGSRVAGHAKPSSDVDVLLILENYDKGVLYLYEEYRGYLFAVLTVDKALFELDLEKSELGEFVVGRLLTPFIPMEGAEYLREASVKFKMRVVLETLASLQSEYPEAYTDLRIKPEFFLYEKLWKRASIYPPVKYSYSRILSDELKPRNLPMMMDGFMEALKKLEVEGIVKFENGYVIPVKSLEIKPSLKSLSIFRELKRATRAYITHGYAGRRVSPMKVAWEFASKAFRGGSLREHGELERSELSQHFCKYPYLES
ncbi:nucleotidyltransferase domain-containing protein [Candidatus Bathyarchaeota archaeon]|nr:nucleotidyltransferase domain-containing protein [Candidatus Bathyarchaeota archaeon]